MIAMFKEKREFEEKAGCSIDDMTIPEFHAELERQKGPIGVGHTTMKEFRYWNSWFDTNIDYMFTIGEQGWLKKPFTYLSWRWWRLREWLYRKKKGMRTKQQVFGTPD